MPQLRWLRFCKSRGLITDSRASLIEIISQGARHVPHGIVHAYVVSEHGAFLSRSQLDVIDGLYSYWYLVQNYFDPLRLYTGVW